jgi:hypothetical protein
VTGADGDLAGATGDGTLAGRFLTYATRDRNGCDVKEIKGVVAGPMVGNLHLVATS